MSAWGPTPAQNCCASPTTPNALYINGSSGGDVYLANSKFHAKAAGGCEVNDGSVVIGNHYYGYQAKASDGSAQSLIFLNSSNYIKIGTSNNSKVVGTIIENNLTCNGTLSANGTINATSGHLIANNCTAWDGGVSGGYINTSGRLCLVSGASTTYPQALFVVNKSKTAWTQLRSTNSSGTYTITLPASSGTLALSSSDIRLKTNLKPTQVKALDVLNKINLYAYDWTPEGREDSPHWSVGMVADQIESLDKNLVSGGGYFADGTMNVKTIDTFYLCGYIVKAIQELSKDIDQLRKK